MEAGAGLVGGMAGAQVAGVTSPQAIAQERAARGRGYNPALASVFARWGLSRYAADSTWQRPVPVSDEDLQKQIMERMLAQPTEFLRSMMAGQIGQQLGQKPEELQALYREYARGRGAGESVEQTYTRLALANTTSKTRTHSARLSRSLGSAGAGSGAAWELESRRG